LLVLAHSDRFSPDRGPGLHDRDRAIARRRFPRAHAENVGQSIRDRAQNAGRRAGRQHRRSLGARQQRDAVERRVAYIILKDWSERGEGEDLMSLFNKLNADLAAIPEANILVMPPPPIQGIGNDAGFTMQVELRDGSCDMAKVQSVTNAIVANAKTQSGPAAGARLVPLERSAIPARRRSGEDGGAASVP